MSWAAPDSSMAPRRQGQLGIVARLATRAEVSNAGVVAAGSFCCTVIKASWARARIIRADQASRHT